MVKFSRNLEQQVHVLLMVKLSKPGEDSITDGEIQSKLGETSITDGESQCKLGEASITDGEIHPNQEK